MIHSVETGRRLPFYNPVSSVVETPEFTPDGRHIYFSATIDGWAQICEANINGSDMRRISHVRAIEVSPKVNPKNRNRDAVHLRPLRPSAVLDDEWRRRRYGDAHYRRRRRLPTRWSPNGQIIAFAWTRGYEIGEFNIFVMDVAKRVPVQLTHGNGRNENPWWATRRRAPGLHLQARQLDPDLHHARRWYERAAAHHARE